MISIDGLVWDIPCDISRVSEMRSSNISGALLDRSYFNDVLGTYLKYDVTLACPPGMPRKYATIYELLTTPRAEHQFVLPYNNNTITVVGRVTAVSDVYVRLPGGAVYWKGTKFTIEANQPSKMLTLYEAETYGGIPIVPEVDSVEVGDLYQYTADGWVMVTYGDADARRY